MKRFAWLLIAALLLCPAPAKGAGWTATKIKAYFKHEPSLRSLQKAALKFFMVNPARLHALRRKAANKAWLPVVEAGFSGNLAQTTRAMELAQYRNSYDYPWEDENQIYTGYNFHVKATWNLPQLVFNAEELDVASMVGIQDGVLKEVTRLYFIRRRLQINLLLSPPDDAKTRVMLDLRLQELTGLLDAMTNGYLSKKLKAAKKNNKQNATLKNKNRRALKKHKEVVVMKKVRQAVVKAERAAQRRPLPPVRPIQVIDETPTAKQKVLKTIRVVRTK
jgi:hypothetical protein